MVTVLKAMFAIAIVILALPVIFTGLAALVWALFWVGVVVIVIVAIMAIVNALTD